MSIETRTTKNTEDEYYLQLQINQFCKYILNLKYYYIILNSGELVKPTLVLTQKIRIERHC